MARAGRCARRPGAAAHLRRLRRARARSCAGGAPRCWPQPRLATPRRFPEGFPPTVAAGALRRAGAPGLIAFKERGRAELAAAAGDGAGARGGRGGAPPSRGRAGRRCWCRCRARAAALRTRGRDHVRELTARGGGRAAGGGAAGDRRPGCCAGGAGSRDSAGLSAAPAAGQPGRDVRVDPPAASPAGRCSSLVDDVVTSGATLTEAAASAARRGPPGRPAGARRGRRGDPATAVTATSRATCALPDAARERSRRPPDRLSGRGRRD